MEYLEICETNYDIFHQMACAYYREGEDRDTPQDEIDTFIRYLFDLVNRKEIQGHLAWDGHLHVGFALWTIDTGDFPFSELPGYGTILEIGIAPSYRASGLGREFVAFIEESLRRKNAVRCYISAYGPAMKFWKHCGYSEKGQTAKNGLPVMVKVLQ